MGIVGWEDDAMRFYIISFRYTVGFQPNEYAQVAFQLLAANLEHAIERGRTELRVRCGGPTGNINGYELMHAGTA